MMVVPEVPINNNKPRMIEKEEDMEIIFIVFYYRSLVVFVARDSVP